METPIGDDDDSHLGDFIEDLATIAPSDAAVNASLRDVCKDILDTLTPREAKVLRMRFGIEMNTDHTLEEVGKSSTSRASGSARSRPRRCASWRHPSCREKLWKFSKAKVYLAGHVPHPDGQRTGIPGRFHLVHRRLRDVAGRQCRQRSGSRGRPRVANASLWVPARPRSATHRRRVAAPPMTRGATHGRPRATLTAAVETWCRCDANESRATCVRWSCAPCLFACIRTVLGAA